MDNNIIIYFTLLPQDHKFIFFKYLFVLLYYITVDLYLYDLEWDLK